MLGLLLFTLCIKYLDDGINGFAPIFAVCFLLNIPAAVVSCPSVLYHMIICEIALVRYQ